MPWNPDTWIHLAQAIIAACGFIIVTLQLRNTAKQLRTSKSIERSKLILALTEAAMKYSSVIELLADRNYEFEKSEKKDDEEQARCFLRLLEAIALMKENGVIEIRDIFPLFGYRILSFMNHAAVRKSLLKPDEDGLMRARHCGAFNLYLLLFEYLVENFGKNLPAALKEYNHFDGNNPRTLESSLYFDDDFADAASVYYLYHGKPMPNDVFKKRIENIQLSLKKKIKESRSLAKR